MVLHGFFFAVLPLRDGQIRMPKVHHENESILSLHSANNPISLLKMWVVSLNLQTQDLTIENSHSTLLIGVIPGGMHERCILRHALVQFQVPLRTDETMEPNFTQHLWDYLQQCCCFLQEVGPLTRCTKLRQASRTMQSSSFQGLSSPGEKKSVATVLFRLCQLDKSIAWLEEPTQTQPKAKTTNANGAVRRDLWEQMHLRSQLGVVKTFRMNKIQSLQHTNKYWTKQALRAPWHPWVCLGRTRSTQSVQWGRSFCLDCWWS